MHPFEPGREYTIGQLRTAAAEILQARQNDPNLSAAMRMQEKENSWAKKWNEELYPFKVLADHLKLSADTIFRWTPLAAADFELQTASGTAKIQSTTAYAEREGTVGKQGGHVRKLGMIKYNADGFSFGGGLVSEPRARSEQDDVSAWRAGIALALTKKLKPEYSGCWLLIFAPRCQFETIDFEFNQVVTPAIELVGRAAWEEVFEGLYVFDEPPSAFADFRRAIR
jgi:hypothetical protein